MSLTNEYKEKILAELAARRANFDGSDARFAATLGIGSAQYSRIKRGDTAGVLADGAVRTIEVEYTGDITDVSTKLLTTAVVKGLLNPILETNVNYVNAPSLAKERGITVREVKNKEAANFANLITVKVKTEKKEVALQGALFGNEGRIVAIDGYRGDGAPRARGERREWLEGATGVSLGSDAFFPFADGLQVLLILRLICHGAFLHAPSGFALGGGHRIEPSGGLAGLGGCFLAHNPLRLLGLSAIIFKIGHRVLLLG